VSVLARFLQRGADEVLTVEPMRRRHLSAVLPIERASYPRPWTEGVFRSEIERATAGDRYYLVARLGTQVVGYGGLMFALDEAHVTNVAVHADHRRRHLGTRLLGELVAEALRRSCTAMTLEVRVSNEAAQALYREFGFVPAGVRQRYYENVEDAIVMWCHDLADPAYRQRVVALCPEVAW
jgi:[ribosomal protein S18]-alanine N-acetyltransferase